MYLVVSEYLCQLLFALIMALKLFTALLQSIDSRLFNITDNSWLMICLLLLREHLREMVWNPGNRHSLVLCPRDNSSAVKCTEVHDPCVNHVHLIDTCINSSQRQPANPYNLFDWTEQISAGQLAACTPIQDWFRICPEWKIHSVYWQVPHM